MARRTDPSEDNWHNVEDAKARKKIQDRLAQRARSKHTLSVSAIRLRRKLIICTANDVCYAYVSVSDRPGYFLAKIGRRNTKISPPLTQSM